MKSKKSKKIKTRGEDIEKKVKSKTKSKSREEAPEAKGSKKEKLAYTIGRDFYRKVVKDAEKQFNLSSFDLDTVERLSTGMLSTDLISGGGIMSGSMVQVSGVEKSGKSTMCMHTFGSAIRNDVPINNYWDAENALNAVVARNATGFNLRSVFNGENKRASLYSESGLEIFYNASRKVMKAIPDKIFNHEEKQWFYVFDADKEGRAAAASFGFGDAKYSKALYSSSGRLYFEAANGMPQGFIACDSYPSLVPELVDDKEEGGGGMAVMARAFSENIRKIVGKMRRKAFILFGVNQIRVNPGQKYGNPYYEPGGDALKFYSSMRHQSNVRVVPEDEGWSFGKRPGGETTKEYSIEPSIVREGIKDRYAYVHIRNTKNKMGMPFLETWMRVQIRDFKNEGCGYDPVYDTLQYLKATGRLRLKNKKSISREFGIDLPEADVKHKGFSKKQWTYADFKQFVLASSPLIPKEVRREISNRFDKKGGMFDLRAMLFKELKSGAAMKMLAADKGSEGGTIEDLEGDDD